MAILWILLIAVAAYMSTIALVVLGEETHPLISVVLFVALAVLAVWLFKNRVTRI